MTDTATDEWRTRLKLSAVRALLGNVPATLRSVSLEARGQVIHFRAVFVPEATAEQRELLSVAATEVISDFPASFDLCEEYLDLAPPAKPRNLECLVYLRAESVASGGWLDDLSP